MFKALISKGHPEFSTNRQQDAQEFFLHLINMVEVRMARGPLVTLLLCACTSPCLSSVGPTPVPSPGPQRLPALRRPCT